MLSLFFSHSLLNSHNIVIIYYVKCYVNIMLNIVFLLLYLCKYYFPRPKLCNMITFPFFYPQLLSPRVLIISPTFLLLSLIFCCHWFCTSPSPKPILVTDLRAKLFTQPIVSPAHQQPVNFIFFREICAEPSVLMFYAGLAVFEAAV